MGRATLDAFLRTLNYVACASMFDRRTHVSVAMRRLPSPNRATSRWALVVAKLLRANIRLRRRIGLRFILAFDRGSEAPHRRAADRPCSRWPCRRWGRRLDGPMPRRPACRGHGVEFDLAGLWILPVRDQIVVRDRQRSGGTGWGDVAAVRAGNEPRRAKSTVTREWRGVIGLYVVSHLRGTPSRYHRCEHVPAGLIGNPDPPRQLPHQSCGPTHRHSRTSS